MSTSSIHLGLTASSTNYQLPGGQCSGAPRYFTAEKPPVEPPVSRLGRLEPGITRPKKKKLGGG